MTTLSKIPRAGTAALRALALTAVAAGSLMAFGANAQTAEKSADSTADKSVVPEAVAAVPAFTQWVNTVVLITHTAPAQASISQVPLTLAGAPSRQVYEAWPVIVGAPELPLIGTGVAAAGRNWGNAFNYQGMHVRLLVLDASGQRIESRPVSAPMRAGERFKIRLAATFGAVAEVGQVVGEPWNSHRTGQLYPAPGMSVQLNAGETVDLPLAAGDFFVMGITVNERLLLSVRHAQATAEARSTQPAYRMDERGGSSYLQLVPRGTHPAIEQLISLAR